VGAITYFVVLPFVRNEDGDLCPEQAVECQSSHGAAARARAIAASKGGAVAFCRTGDPALGEFDEAEIIAKVGDVPVDLLEATGG